MKARPTPPSNGSAKKKGGRGGRDFGVTMGKGIHEGAVNKYGERTKHQAAAAEDAAEDDGKFRLTVTWKELGEDDINRVTRAVDKAAEAAGAGGDEGATVSTAITEDACLDQARSTTQFVVMALSLGGGFAMAPQQATALLSSNQRYLVHMLTCGVQGDYEKVVGWCRAVFDKASTLIALMEFESKQNPTHPEETVQRTLALFTTLCHSQNIDVAHWGCRILTRLCHELHKIGLGKAAWEWFIGPEKDCGLNALLACHHMHPAIKNTLVPCLEQFGRGKLAELFAAQIGAHLPQVRDHLGFVHEVMASGPIQDSSRSRRNMINSGAAKKVSAWPSGTRCRPATAAARPARRTAAPR